MSRRAASRQLILFAQPKLTRDDPTKLREEAAALGRAVDELDATLHSRRAHASPGVVARAARALEALKGLHGLLETASRRCE